MPKNKLLVYKIDCEYDMGFDDLYATKELAEKAIKEAEWDICDMTLAQVKKRKLVSIQEIEVTQE